MELLWFDARQTRMHHNAIGKAVPRKTGQTQVAYDTEPRMYYSKKQWALDQHFSKSVTWTTIFKGCKLALQKNRVSMTKYI